MSVGLLRRNSQVGAPKLWANAYGSLVDVLQAVLVDGYGAYPGLGWTKEYESPDTNTIVFRNSPVDGTGVYLRVSHSSYIGLATNFADFALYESMSDWNIGLSRAPSIGILAIMQVGSSTGVVCVDGVHWLIIGDSTGFWLCLRPYLAQYADIVSPNNGRVWRCYYFGDYIAANQSMQWPCFIAGQQTATTIAAFGPLSLLGVVKSYNWVIRNGLYSIGSAQVGIMAGSGYEPTSIGATPNISPINGQTLLTPVSIHDANSILLGYLPGLRNPLRQKGSMGAASYANADEEYIASDRTLHLMLYQATSEGADNSPRVGLISGEGFRNVI